MLQFHHRFAAMPWNEIDSVAFDVGNVLLTFQPDTMLAQLFPDDADMRRTLKEKMFDSPYWNMMDRGTLDKPQAARAMAAGDAKLEQAMLGVLRVEDDYKQPIPEGARAVKACKEHGKRVFVLSNYSADGFEYVKRRFDVFQLFDGFVVSGCLKLLKPEPAIYRHLLDTFRLDPARTLFIDDSPQNIEGALNIGMQGLCFRKPGTLDAFLK
ncbi:MAG: HAD family phosphatase [Eubacteriales bacterium]|nr:HAD family phosphatase [Eubacteriales bacterium]